MVTDQQSFVQLLPEVVGYLLKHTRWVAELLLFNFPALLEDVLQFGILISDQL